MPLVGTSGIAAAAATAVQQATSASGSRTTSNPDYGAWAYSDVTSQTYTNATSAAVQVQIEHFAIIWASNNVTTGGAGTTQMFAEYSLSGGGGSGSVNLANIGVNGAAGFVSPEVIVPHNDMISVSAGVTITVKLRVGALINSAQDVRIDWRDARSRVTAILR